MASLLTRALLVLVCGFAALSSSAAVALGLAEERVLVFTGLLLALLALPLLSRPALARPSGPALLLALLLAGIVVTDVGGIFDPVDAKVALPVLVLLAGPNLARQMTPAELTRFVWRLLSFYVAVTFLYQVVAEPAVVARGHEGIVRYDPTGSVVMHSSLSLIHLVLAVTRLGERQPLRARLATLALGGMSLSMVFLTATRTALLTLALLAVLTLLVSPEPHRAARRLAMAALGFGLAFAAWTALVDDSFYLRLTGGQEDFTSGRWSSVRHWLALAGEHPWGMGLGAARELLADGRPALDGTKLLECPHNELVRFYLEAGPPGLLFVLLLLAVLLRRALRAAAREDDPERRMLILAIAADLVAEACLQNLLNAVYHATVLILVLILAVALAGREDVGRAARPGQAPAPMPC
ncbi:MAG TPA: O-antigen ligase family protein [Geminicoccaceae bacterium]|nr:O-antigen ligase family protein [Geminicoccaceae bacterium]